MDRETVPKSFADMLLQQNAMLQNTINTLQSSVASLQSTIEQLTAVIEEKDQIILNQNRARFGQSSEKRAYVIDERQISMFEQAGDGSITETAASTPSEPEKTVAIPAHERKPKRKLEELCANLPVEEVICDLPESERLDAQGNSLKCIGKECVRTELCREKAKVWVKKYYTLTYADPAVEEQTGYADIRKASAPAPLLQHSYASASVVTDVIIRKFVEAMPLYRQEQSWKREFGVQLKRGTMANWVILTTDIYLKPFWSCFRDELLRQNVIHADETVLQVLKEKGRRPTDESRMWVYASSKRSDRQIRLFRYEGSRAGACAEEMLKGFNGTLVADGYSGYNLVGNVTRAGCWAHMRRKWYEAMPRGATVQNSKAAVGYEYCNHLFETERQMEQLSDSERRKQRQLLAKPLVDEYYGWLETLFNPTGKLKQAVTYAHNQREYLCAFLAHGEIEISNNQVENAIRPLVVGRKNWLFADTPEGAQASAIAYTFMETAKANGLNAEKYLLHVLSVLPERFANNPSADIRDLLPWAVEMKNRFAD